MVMPNNHKRTGELSEGMILANLLSMGYSVSLPFGDNQRYDMVLDEGGKLLRCQCKTARASKSSSGAIEFCTDSMNNRTGERKTYVGDADVFLVYYPTLKTVYKVPVIPGISRTMTLRLSPSKNGQTKGVRLASDFVFMPS